MKMHTEFSTTSSDILYSWGSFEDKDYTDQATDPLDRMLRFHSSFVSPSLPANGSIMLMSMCYSSFRWNALIDKSDLMKKVLQLWGSTIKASPFIEEHNTYSLIVSDLSRITDRLQDTWKPQVLSPEKYYAYEVSKLPNIEAIVFYESENIKRFTTILSKRDIEVREKIYDIELKMIEIYLDFNIYFVIDYITKSTDLNSLITNKRVLYHKPMVHAL